MELSKERTPVVSAIEGEEDQWVPEITIAESFARMPVVVPQCKSPMEIMDAMAVVVPRFKTPMEILDAMPVVVPKCKSPMEIGEAMARLTLTNISTK